MFKNIARLLGGDPIKRDLDRFTQVVNQINDLEAEFEKLDNTALRAKTDEFRTRIQTGMENGRTQAEMLDEILPQAFAAVREAAKRTLGQRHYDVQLIGGMALHNARIAEMRTGEGKTLVATLPSYLNALTGRGVHVITVNDYLARRDARWMAPIYNLLGLSVGVLQMAARTENGRKAFLVNLDKTSPQEDQHQLDLVDRVEAYRADITYGTNSEFGFDYLRDNLTNRLEDRVQRGHYFAIVDEVDNILIDEARTPLIISGPAAENTEWYIKMAQVVRQLNPEDYEVNEKDRQVSLTEIGEAHVEELLDMPLRDPERPEDITPEQARAMGFLEQALRAQFLYHRNKEYLVQSGKVIIVDEFTGRLMPGRRWSEGLHQAVEAKEGVKIEPENVTYATITIQNYFRMYEKLSGMTGTALTEAEEFSKIYKLDVLPIPMNLEFQAMRSDSPLMAVEEKDEQGYRYTKYVLRSDPTRAVFFRRKDYPDVVYRTEEGKLRAIIQEIIYYHVIGRPQLVGTTSVEHSERLSLRLGAEPIRRLLQALLLRHTWLEKYNQPAERDIPELRFLNRPVDELNPAEMRALGRGLGLNSINVEEPENLNHLLAILGLNAGDAPRLLRVVQGGIPHQVLNARKHDEESMIIARAGGFGMVTIATNMAGRGVDIKLGGELPESVLADVIHVLDRAGVDDPYNMTNDARRQELLKLDPASYELYAESVQAFFKYLDDMARVRELGGLHVIGSERHEARRIDNQLRGRAARQGDPGSSRFYLSLEDELMRLFGGGQVEALMKRLAIDESMPIESGIIGRLVEQSQMRVEGANFDVRKHLLEYDDVLNSQRKRIYAERDRVFTKEDLRDDVLDMLRTELQKRIPESLKDEEGPWKLLAYLEEIQPSSAFELENIQLPSFPVRLMAGELARRTARDGGHEGLRSALISIAESALQEERDHILRSARTLLDRAEESYDQQRAEREDALDAFFDGLGEVEEGMPPRRPQEILDELSSLLRIPLRLNNEQMRQLPQGGNAVREALRQQVETGLISTTVTRVIGALERRLDEPLGLRANQLLFPNWEEIAAQLLQATQEALDRRSERLLGTRGQIYQNIDTILSQERRHKEDEDYYAALLMSMPVGTKLAIDPHSHRKGWRRVILLNYTFLAARLLSEMRPQDVSDAILEHLEGVLERLQRVWGLAEWERLTQNQIPLSGLISRVQEQARAALGEERFNQLANAPLSELTPEERSILVDLFGTRLQNEVYRQILLGVISELWVDYLTRVEALRVSIGLEAYAQRDPLVMYKGKASEMFGQLLSDIRMGVISRIFVMQPRRSSSAAAPVERGEPQPEAEVPANSQVKSPSGEDRKKKRRRH